MRVLVYNVERGGPGKRRAGVEEMIGDLSPDVAVILEAVGWRTRGVGEKILQDLGGGEVFYGPARTGFDLAILTKRPARNPILHPDLELFHGLLSLEVEMGEGSWVRLHAVHLSPTREDVRAAEVEAILGAIGPLDGGQHVIAGDLNGVRRGDTIDGMPVGQVPEGIGPVWRQDKLPPQAIDRIARDGWIDVFRDIHPEEVGYTFPSREPVVRYDYVFASPAFRKRVTGIEVMRRPGIRTLSDHLPLLMHVR